MISSIDSKRRPKAKRESRRVDLEEVLQSLRLVLEFEPEHLDGAIDLLDEAIHHDQRLVPKVCGCRN
jgi:hypothetical protein